MVPGLWADGFSSRYWYTLSQMRRGHLVSGPCGWNDYSWSAEGKRGVVSCQVRVLGVALPIRSAYSGSQGWTEASASPLTTIRGDNKRLILFSW